MPTRREAHVQRHPAAQGRHPPVLSSYGERLLPSPSPPNMRLHCASQSPSGSPTGATDPLPPYSVTAPAPARPLPQTQITEAIPPAMRSTPSHPHPSLPPGPAASHSVNHQGPARSTIHHPPAGCRPPALSAGQPSHVTADYFCARQQPPVSPGGRQRRVRLVPRRPPTREGWGGGGFWASAVRK